MIDTVHGASASVIIYSISETAKANGLKPYEYFEYLLTEIPKHQDESSTDFLADLLPWSEKLPEYIRKPKKASEKWHGRQKRPDICQGTCGLAFTNVQISAVVVSNKYYIGITLKEKAS